MEKRVTTGRNNKGRSGAAPGPNVEKRQAGDELYGSEAAYCLLDGKRAEERTDFAAGGMEVK